MMNGLEENKAKPTVHIVYAHRLLFETMVSEQTASMAHEVSPESHNDGRVYTICPTLKVESNAYLEDVSGWLKEAVSVGANDLFLVVPFAPGCFDIVQRYVASNVDVQAGGVVAVGPDRTTISDYARERKAPLETDIAWDVDMFMELMHVCRASTVVLPCYCYNLYQFICVLMELRTQKLPLWLACQKQLVLIPHAATEPGYPNILSAVNMSGDQWCSLLAAVCSNAVSDFVPYITSVTKDYDRVELPWLAFLSLVYPLREPAVVANTVGELSAAGGIFHDGYGMPDIVDPCEPTPAPKQAHIPARP